MSQTCLYNKYRPNKLSEVVGQDHIKKYFTNATGKDKISHAYLFCGGKGLGKTSMARIVSLIVNCENGPKVDYDLNDKNVKSIIEGSCPDVHELDAASSTSIDHIREIRSLAKNFPIMCRKRVFIIDEVARLNAPAASALLKVLEEPPESAMFILCTTEPHKILPTILSRCQRLNFYSIPHKEISAYLLEICKKEGIKNVEDDSLALISKAARGSMRDALSILEPVITQSDGSIKKEDIQSLIGNSLGQGIFCDLLGYFCTGDYRKAIATVRKVVSTGADLEKIFLEFLEHSYDMMLAKSVSTTGFVYLEDATVEKWKKIVKETDIEILAYVCKKFMNYVDMLNTTRRIDIALDTCIIEIINDIKNGKYKTT